MVTIRQLLDQKDRNVCSIGPDATVCLMAPCHVVRAKPCPRPAAKGRFVVPAPFVTADVPSLGVAKEKSQRG